MEGNTSGGSFLDHQHDAGACGFGESEIAMSSWSFPSVAAGSTYLILGLGETGVAAALWCLERGARLRVLDTRAAPPARQALDQSECAANIDYRLGPDALRDSALEGVSVVVLSPGLAPFEQPVSGFLEQARQRGIEIIGEVEIFARALLDLAAQGYTPHVLAITGTNGKTTVTRMTCQLLEASGMTAVAAGNISPAAVQALRVCLQQDTLPQVWVLELSSFQLHTLTSLVPDAAVVLNLTQDHLDWHGSMQAYAEAKARLLRMARVRVVNRDDSLTVAMVDALANPNVRSFGRTVPELDGDLGLESEHGIEWLTACESSDFEAPVVRSGRSRKNDTALLRLPGRSVRLMPAEALHVQGRHNALNALAALALVRSLGVGWAEALQALRAYRGEPHRAEFVRSVSGVDFINDSKGTNVGATVAALEGMGRGVVLIAGGLGKGQDFSPLARAVAAYAKAVVLIGQDAPLIAQALQGLPLNVRCEHSLASAVQASFELATPGDAVMLSPACASMDMFRNYGHRGQAFVDEVNELALRQGEVA